MPIAGHVSILEHTEEFEPSNYKTNYRLVKYKYDDNGLILINNLNFDFYQESHIATNIAISCIPKSTQAVLLFDRSFVLMDTETIETQCCLNIKPSFKAIATDENHIYIAYTDMLYKYNRIGCLMEQTKFEYYCKWFAFTLNGNIACHSGDFCLLKADGSRIFSYCPKGLKSVTVDDNGQIYLAIRDGIQVLDPLKMETEMVYKYDKKIADGLKGFVFNQDKDTLFLLGIESTKDQKFGKIKCYHSMKSCSESGKKYYVCPLCNYRTDSYSNNRCEGLRDRLLDFNKFVIKVLTK
ncbi:unnamed protein product [Mytilus coruscus]|uniref:Uncharacterized protein n=1 Tax=Mytilus coruscus TaxID=42192 RepID=A0A6J8A7I3_MYTCO|nr:unnamed protein product [Mytilus coruscus]